MTLAWVVLLHFFVSCSAMPATSSEAKAAGAIEVINIVDLESEGGPTKRFAESDQVAELAVKIASLQKDLNTYEIVKYSDESADPLKAKLVRGKAAGVEANVSFLKLAGDVSLGRKQIEFVLTEVIKINNLKFKKSETEEWIDIQRKRWMNLVRCVQQAAGKKKQPKWIEKVLPWMVKPGDGAAAEDTEKLQERMG
jgi:hypothetical protein